MYNTLQKILFLKQRTYPFVNKSHSNTHLIKEIAPVYSKLIKFLKWIKLAAYTLVVRAKCVYTVQKYEFVF